MAAESAGQNLSDAATTVKGASKAVALMGRRYFDSARDGLGSCAGSGVINQSREFDDLSMICTLLGMEGKSLGLHPIRKPPRIL